MSARNAYYGTPFVELDRFNIDVEHVRAAGTPGSSSIEISEKLGLMQTEHHTIGDDQLSKLCFDPLRQLYADGLRAASAESKFFHWFIILEEFLEKSKKLNASFTPLFDEKEDAVVRSIAGLLGGRQKGGLVNSLKLTRESRHEKLVAILHKLGIMQVMSIAGTNLDITADLCHALIEQRNRLFHRGKRINEDQLYNALFPIVTQLAHRSTEILDWRDE